MPGDRRSHFSFYSTSLNIQGSASLRRVQADIWQKCGQGTEKSYKNALRQEHEGMSGEKQVAQGDGVVEKGLKMRSER